jgi:DNA-directed RNA polymerase specialized sigma24 family protein
VSESVMPDESDDESDNEAKQAMAPAALLPDSVTQASCAARDALLPGAELDAWRLMDNSQRCTELRAIIRGKQGVRLEVLVYECTRAHEERNRHMLNLAFAALSERATPLLLRQARALPWHERHAQAQQVLLELFEAIVKGKAGFAQNRFAAFTKRISISLYRKRRARFEGAYARIQPIEDSSDPLLDIPTHKPSTEALALLECAQDRLPEKLRRVFIQYHRLGMRREAIARHHGVSVRSIYNWIKDAEAAIGYSGETHGRK